MLGDRDWIETSSREQQRRNDTWLRALAGPVVVEVGAGSTVTTVCAYVHTLEAPHIRINPREWQVPQRRDVGLAVGARDRIEGI